MNNKGFAISVILYSVIFVIITILFILLGTVKVRYTTTDKLRKNIIENLNDESIISNNFNSKETCTITSNSTDYTDNLILTINVSHNGGYLYSFDNVDFTNNNSIKVDHSGQYTGYFIDKKNGKGSCKDKIKIVSTIKYRYRDCDNIELEKVENSEEEAWYKTKDTNETSCNQILKTNPERRNDTLYYRECTSIDVSNCNNSSTCFNVKEYSVNIHCANNPGWSNWSNWNDIRPTSYTTREIESTEMYKVN